MAAFETPQVMLIGERNAGGDGWNIRQESRQFAKTTLPQKLAASRRASVSQPPTVAGLAPRERAAPPTATAAPSRVTLPVKPRNGK
jgi:hypothetical protein